MNKSPRSKSVDRGYPLTLDDYGFPHIFQPHVDALISRTTGARDRVAPLFEKVLKLMLKLHSPQLLPPTFLPLEPR